MKEGIAMRNHFSIILVFSSLLLTACSSTAVVSSSPSPSLNAAPESTAVPSEPSETPVPKPTSYTDADTGTIYTAVDESAILPTYIQHTEPETEVTRFPDQIQAEYLSSEDGYSWFAFRDTESDDSVSVGVLSPLPDLELQITGEKAEEGDRIYLALNFNHGIANPLQKSDSRYGLYWYNWNYASIDGVDFQNYVLCNTSEAPGKGGEVAAESNGWQLIRNDSYYSTVMGSADVSDEEKQEVEVLHQNEFIILK
jgi:hypothetical protein